MSRRGFWAWLVAGVAGLAGSRVSASPKEEARIFRQDADGRWLEIGQLDAREGDKVIMVGLTGNELWLADGFTVGKGGSHIVDGNPAVYMDVKCEWTRLVGEKWE